MSQNEPLIFSYLHSVFQMERELQEQTRRCFVSHKMSDTAEYASTRGIRMPAISERWRVSSGALRDTGFLQSWLEVDSDLVDGGASDRFNWGAISGMVLAVLVSAGCWAGLAMIVARIWR